MALKVPETFLSKDETRRYADPELARFHLPPNHLADLRDVARGVEETDAGVCCSYLVDSMSGEGSDFDEHALNALERYAEQALTFEFLSETFGAPVVASWRARIQRCRRAVAALHLAGNHTAVSVLFVAYGYPDPILRQLPDLLELGYVLAPLAKYTDAVEERRVELVRSLSLSAVRPSVVDLVAVRERAAWLDRTVSSGDALRAALSAFPEPPPVQKVTESYAAFEARKAARKDRELAWRERRVSFLSAVRGEALRMLSAAEKAYHDAWLRSAAPRTSAQGFRAKRSYERRREPVIPPARLRGSGWSTGHE